jgi:enamine deaminase RidA (YjgF/YER057c/UK114 family)
MQQLMAVCMLLACLQLKAQNGKTFTLVNPKSLTQSPAYSQMAIIQPGTQLVLLSGQVAQDSLGNNLGKGDIAMQTQLVYANLEKALTAIGASFADVAAFKIYLTDTANLQKFRAVRNQLLYRWRYTTSEYRINCEWPIPPRLVGRN